jgi:hypothetical protein
MANITDLIIPAGKIYFDPKDPITGLLTGERYFGDTPGCTMNVESSSLEVWSSDDQISELAANVPLSVKRGFKFKAIDVSDDNLALFVVGEVGTVAQSTAAVVDEAIADVQQGRYYQIGKSTSIPTGRRGLSAITVKVGATTMDLNDDYTIEADLGRIYIVPGGAIVDDDDILVSYTYATNSRSQIISTGNNDVQFGALHFIANNTKGRNRDFYLPEVALTGNGDSAIKREGKDGKVWEMEFNVNVFTPATGAQLYIDGRAA